MSLSRNKEIFFSLQDTRLLYSLPLTSQPPHQNLVWGSSKSTKRVYKQHFFCYDELMPRREILTGFFSRKTKKNIRDII